MNPCLSNLNEPGTLTFAHSTGIPSGKHSDIRHLPNLFPVDPDMRQSETEPSLLAEDVVDLLQPSERLREGLIFEPDCALTWPWQSREWIGQTRWRCA